jgi:hypothetical protein
MAADVKKFDFVAHGKGYFIHCFLGHLYQQRSHFLSCSSVQQSRNITNSAKISILKRSRFQKKKKMSALRVMVGVKRVIDYAVKIRVKPDKVTNSKNTLRFLSTKSMIQLLDFDSFIYRKVLSQMGSNIP